MNPRFWWWKFRHRNSDWIYVTTELSWSVVCMDCNDMYYQFIDRKTDI